MELTVTSNRTYFNSQEQGRKRRPYISKFRYLEFIAEMYPQIALIFAIFVSANSTYLSSNGI